MPALARDPFENIFALPVVNRGAWLATASGGHWSIEYPCPRDLHFSDLAIGLSRICRYAGQIREDREFYAVTEHSDLMTDFALETGIARTLEQALSVKFHDGAEFVFGDMATPLKRMLPNYKVLEKTAQAVILEAFGLKNNPHALDAATVKMLDNRIFLDETDQLLIDPGRDATVQAFKLKNPDLAPMGIDLPCRGVLPARRAFAEHFISLCENVPAADPRILESLAPHIEQARDLIQRMDDRELAAETERLEM